MAGDAAANAVAENMTAENINAASKHATKENAELAWEGAKYADQKCDEYGIDKKEVAYKVGNAAYEAAKKVDWAAVGRGISSAASGAYNAAQSMS